MSLLVLGGSGKVGALLMQVGFGGTKAIWQARRHLPWADWVWDGTGPVPAALPLAEDADPIDAVLALWGAVPPHEDLDMNRVLALRALEVAEQCGAGRVLFASSAAVYPQSDGPHREDGPVAPFSDYGHAKLEMEKAVAQYAGKVQTCCMRIGNVVGADSLWPALIAGEVTLDRFETGHGPLRSYVTAQDLAASIEALAYMENLPKCINIASQLPVYMDDLANAANAKITWKAAPKEATAQVVLDTTLLENFVELVPKTAAQMILSRRL